MRKPNGFTLIEILIAMSLFTLIGLAVVLLMSTGADIYVRGNRSSQAEDRREQSLPRLEEDLRQMLVPRRHRDRIPFDPQDPDPRQEPDALPPENRCLSGYVTFRARGDREVRCRYLAFVRDLSGMGEIETYAARAGTNPQASAYIDGKDDEEEFKGNQHLPTGGAVEVLWIWLPDPDRPGVGAVYRAYRTPIGGEGTLLDPKNFDEMDEIWRVIHPQPMFQDVILFDVYFWTQFTTTWEWRPGEPTITGPPQTAAEYKAGRPPCGPSRIWDSTRGVLPKKGDDGFKLWRDRSLNYSGDDIWPRAVRVQFALAGEDTVLAGGLGSRGQEFTVVVSDFATGYGDLADRFMKVGPEWVQIVGRQGARRDTFDVAQRGALGTTRIAHAEGAPVYFGRVFDFTIPIPSFRDDNN